MRAQLWTLSLSMATEKLLVVTYVMVESEKRHQEHGQMTIIR